MKSTISGKVIIVTGASSGIGRATSLAVAREGAKVFLVARREDRLAQLETQIRESGGTAFMYVLDLTQPSAADMMIDAAFEKFGRIDVLINNAAFGYFGTVENTPPEVAREIFELNLQAPLRASQRAIPIMRRQGSGHIINVSSVVGNRGLPLGGIYSATKFALNGLSEALRVELNGTNIFVSLIYPASTKSEFGEAIRKGDVTRNFGPLGHEQTSEEVAEAIVRCIRNPKVEVYTQWPTRFISWMNAIAPSLVDVITARILRERMKARR
jgi:short-subunit dehydrogenase